MKKRQIRRFLFAWFTVYLLIILGSTMFPNAFNEHVFPEPQITGNTGNEAFKMQGCVEMNPETNDYFELLADVQLELYQKLPDDEALNMRYSVGMYSTKNDELGKACNFDQINLRKASRTAVNPDQWNTIVESSQKERSLSNCVEFQDRRLRCQNVPIAKGEIGDFFKYNAFHIDIDQNQANFKVTNFKVNMKQRNVEHTNHLTILKYVFAAVTFVTLYLYWRNINNFQLEDLGLIQKWIMVLLIQLFLFNEPFMGLKWIFPYKSYQFIFAIIQATFLSMILFFWLLIVHSISSNEVINIDEKRFYFPKIALCMCIWLVLTISMTYVNVKQVSDPSFHWRDDLGQFYSAMQILSVILFVLYSSYFVIIAYVAFFQLKDMKKSYKFSLFLTFGVILASIILIIGEGYQTQNDTIMFVAYISLFNIYMYIIAYLYSPSVDCLEDLQFKQARKEHEHIINQFYEQELPDISKDHNGMDSSRDRINISSSSNSSKLSAQKRHQKKDPQQKAKEKLWESIVKETEDEDESSDDEHQI